MPELWVRLERGLSVGGLYVRCTQVEMLAGLQACRPLRGTGWDSVD
jgi:hypothetical protein